MRVKYIIEYEYKDGGAGTHLYNHKGQHIDASNKVTSVLQIFHNFGEWARKNHWHDTYKWISFYEKLEDSGGFVLIHRVRNEDVCVS